MKLLSAPIDIFATVSEIIDVTGVDTGRPKRWLPTDEELVRFIEAIETEHLLR